MITREQEKLAFKKLELKECTKVVELLRNGGPDIAGDLKEWETMLKQLTDEVFEMNVLLGIDV
jgi:hypothetical protein